MRSSRRRSSYSNHSRLSASINTDVIKEDLLNHSSFNDYRTTNVYAEVRGKYARPAPPLEKPVTSMSVFAPSENKLVTRPSTAGSLRAKSSQGKHSRKKEEKSSLKEIEDDRRSLASEATSVRSSYSRRSHSSHRSSKSVHKYHPVKPVDEPSVKFEESKDEVKEENNGEVKEEVVENPEDVILVEPVNEIEKESEKDTISVQSFVTTSSQKRYIEELEDLLRQEKLRRIRAEEQLVKVSSRGSKRPY